jgi:hypothetical protein
MSKKQLKTCIFYAHKIFKKIMSHFCLSQIPKTKHAHTFCKKEKNDMKHITVDTERK